MRHLSFGIATAICALLAQATPAAAAPETWVSAGGDDGGNCNRGNPCKTFAFALTKTNAGGTINVLDSGNFGPVTITKKVSIIAEGAEAVINTVPSGGPAAILVQAGANSVSLRGLTIDVPGKIGIYFISGFLHIDKTVIRRTTNGIRVGPASGTAALYVANTTIADTTSDGVIIAPTGGASAKAVIDRVRVENPQTVGMNFLGENTSGSVTTTVRESVSSGALGSGLIASDNGSGTTTVMVDRSTMANNIATGVFATGAGAKIRIGDSSVTGNGTGLGASSSGVIESYGSNKVAGNTSDGVTPTPIVYR